MMTASGPEGEKPMSAERKGLLDRLSPAKRKVDRSVEILNCRLRFCDAAGYSELQRHASRTDGSGNPYAAGWKQRRGAQDGHRGQWE